MLIKLDMVNAFDRVRHSFLLQVLYAFGFSPVFISLIKACIGDSWITPLINGKPSNYFKASRGIRQGFPLSPFLYILMADSLRRKLTANKLIGTLPGIKATRGTEPINHAMFVDDSLLLGGASLNIARAFNEFIQSFCKVSGALVNRRKSVVYGWGVDQHFIL
jgi:hypothetical protein